MNKLLNAFGDRSISLLAFITLLSVLSWSIGFPFGVKQAEAIALTNVSNTISDSDVSATGVTHTIQFTLDGSVSSGNEISIDFPAGFTNILVGNVTCPATSTASASAQRVECVASGGGVNAGAVSVTVTTVTNPGTPGSYVFSIVANENLAGEETGQAAVAIIDDVTVSAAVNASFTFSIDGVAAGQNVNGETVATSAGATATALPFGILASGTPKVLAQQLSVSTNAINGFVVTVFQNANLLSQTGADIDLFKDGAGTAAPTAWTAPLATLGSEATYGHYGITSEDDLNGTEFGSALYVGNLGTARQIFAHDGPADGVTANAGRTRVAVKIQVSDLQEAADDYTNILTYVATPTF